MVGRCKDAGFGSLLQVCLFLSVFVLELSSMWSYKLRGLVRGLG